MNENWGGRMTEGPRLRPLPQHLAEVQLAAGLCTDEGARSFVTGMCCIHRDSPYKRECERENDGRPSSKPAGALTLSPRVCAVSSPRVAARRRPDRVNSSGAAAPTPLRRPGGGCTARTWGKQKVPYYTAPHTTPHTNLHLNKNREALRQRKLRPAPGRNRSSQRGGSSG
jgi:hypothetical protein